MRLEYRILWVEDNKSWYETTKELFTDTLDELGFRLVSKKCENIDEVKAEISKNWLKEYDLLLVDFTLKNSESGDKIIEFIRGIQEQPILTDIIFYSSAVENVRESMHKLGLEGVYSADRNEIDTKFDLVVNTTIKKVQDINNMRGLVMAEVAELDNKMIDLLKRYVDGLKSEQKQEFIDKRKKRVLESLEKMINDFTDISEVSIFEHRDFNTYHKWMSVKNLVKNIDDKDIKTKLNEYEKEIIQKRNKLAHVKEITGENGERTLADGDFIFNDEICREIRKDLQKHAENFEKIKEKLTV
ncbi:MAG: hypothetical protein JZU53_13155 [Paludibacter sp.]|nr:hypothetical protein [Paludibacter sp.]